MTVAVLSAVVVVTVCLEAVCQIDLYRAETVRYLPKWAWAVICVISIPVGGIVYLSMGKARYPATRELHPAQATYLMR